MFNYLTYISFTDCTEKYLVDRNFSNPFGILLIEGIFGFIMSIIYSINKNPFKDITIKYTQITTGYFVLLIFFLFLYLLFSAILNAYRIYCNVIYSPMARSMADYFASPLLNIYYFLVENDFNGNLFYFLISEIISLAMDFIGCVYNDYLILYCWGLEHDTKDAIFDRVASEEMIQAKYTVEEEDEEDDIQK